jgi:hypothetical protein
MTRVSQLFIVLASCVSVVLLLAACQSRPESDAPIPSPPAGGAPSSAPAPASSAKADEHEHKAPHGGTLVALGEELAHIELVLDPRTGTLTAYTLDGEAEQAVRLHQPSIALEVRLPSAAQPIALELAAVPNALTGETAGDTSQFAVTAASLRGVSRFEGSVAQVSIKGQTFTRVAFQFPEGNEQR